MAKVRQLDVTVSPVEDVTSITNYDAVIIGSALYLGKWMKTRHAVRGRSHSRACSRPVWVYSSGPIPGPESKATTLQGTFASGPSW